VSEQPKEISFMVTSGFGHRERAPYVQVLIEAADWMTQMPPAKARELAANLWEAAEAAEGDGFLMGYMAERIGVEDNRALATVLMDFREYREKARAESEKGGDADDSFVE
jgi:hypothetical protein